MIVFFYDLASTCILFCVVLRCSDFCQVKFMLCSMYVLHYCRCWGNVGEGQLNKFECGGRTDANLNAGDGVYFVVCLCLGVLAFICLFVCMYIC